MLELYINICCKSIGKRNLYIIILYFYAQTYFYIYKKVLFYITQIELQIHCIKLRTEVSL